VTPHERLEHSTWDLFYLPDGVNVIDRPELLALQSERPVDYLNAVYRVRAEAERLPALIDEVETLHRHVESRWHLADTIDTHALATLLSAEGYAATQAHDARVIAVDAFTPKAESQVSVRRIVDEQGLRDCWTVAEEAFGTARNYTDDDAALELSQCAAEDAQVQRFVAYLGEEPVCSGGMSAFPELGFALLWAGGTVPSARGRGAYSAVVAARMARAAQRNIAFVGLYARTDSSSPIVGAQGFENVGRMDYWVGPIRPRRGR
jgi:hypothetical protein